MSTHDIKFLAYDLRKKLSAAKTSKDELLKKFGDNLSEDTKSELVKLNNLINILQDHLDSISEL
jgi:hypothetical protein